jgi:hypothetical protein
MPTPQTPDKLSVILEEWDKKHPNMVGLAVEQEEKSFITTVYNQGLAEGETLAIQRIRNFNFGELGTEMKKYIAEAKAEAIEELVKDAQDHLITSGNLELDNFWMQVITWIDDLKDKK